MIFVNFKIQFFVSGKTTSKNSVLFLQFLVRLLSPDRGFLSEDRKIRSTGNSLENKYYLSIVALHDFFSLLAGHYLPSNPMVKVFSSKTLRDELRLAKYCGVIGGDLVRTELLNISMIYNN